MQHERLHKSSSRRHAQHMRGPSDLDYYLGDPVSYTYNLTFFEGLSRILISSCINYYFSLHAA